MRQLVTITALAIMLGGCASEGDAASDSAEAASACEQAFAVAAEVDDMQDTVADIYPALSACETLDEFEAADETHPSALDGADPETYARNACASASDAAVKQAPLCAEVTAP
jgi:hypothetical protein